MENEIFEYISFTAHSTPYVPDSLKLEGWEPDNWVKHSDMDIPLGHSRYGGCVIDLPKGAEHPENMKFAGQLDLAKIAPYDKSNLLPKSGQLLFFVDDKDNGKVIYADVENTDLIRIFREHEDNFYLGVLIDKISAETETIEERYFTEKDEEFEEDMLNENGKMWNDFAGTEKSKMFGIYTHCQQGEEYILEFMKSNRVVLLQIGGNGFNDEGVFNVLIDKEDLKNRNFNNCIFEWAQS